MTIYAAYNRKTDDLLCVGTARECVKALGIASEASFYSTVCRCAKGTNKKYVIVKVEGEE